jgi:hypothetical protein
MANSRMPTQNGYIISNENAVLDININSKIYTVRYTEWLLISILISS